MTWQEELRERLEAERAVGFREGAEIAGAEIERLRAALGEIDGSRRVPPYLTREEMILVARAALANEQNGVKR